MSDASLSGYHIFDVDKTIVNASTVKDFMFQALREGLISFAVLLYVPYYFIRFSFFEIREEQFRKPFRFLKGISEEGFRRISEKLYIDKFSKHLNRKMVDRINTVRENGGDVIIASSSFRIILEPLMRELSIREAICTELEFTEGICTGRFTGLPAFQTGKKVRVCEYLDEKGIDIKTCTFYSDSYRDMSLLEAAGTPLAVNADKRLRRIAEEKGWGII